MTVKARSPRYIIELARDLRKNPTPAERILWEESKEKKLEGFKFRNQHPVYRYILDFFCHEKRLAIEVDGDIHKKRSDYDEFRDEFLKSMGITTLRFQNKDVIDSILGVLQTIRKALIN
jgi:very-short-patch-repair endonuclease